MTTVVVVHHVYAAESGEEVKLIGIYSSPEIAHREIEKLKEQPGFRSLPEHFSVDEYKLDQTNWSEGYISETYQPTWSIWRQDDNGNQFLVKSPLTEAEALREVRQ